MASTLTLKKPRIDALQLQADDARPQRQWLGGKLVRGEFVVALNGAGDKRREVQRVEQIGAESDVPLFAAISRLNEQMQARERRCRRAPA